MYKNLYIKIDNLLTYNTQYAPYKSTVTTAYFLYSKFKFNTCEIYKIWGQIIILLCPQNWHITAQYYQRNELVAWLLNERVYRIAKV